MLINLTAIPPLIAAYDHSNIEIILNGRGLGDRLRIIRPQEKD